MLSDRQGAGAERRRSASLASFSREQSDGAGAERRRSASLALFSAGAERRRRSRATAERFVSFVQRKGALRRQGVGAERQRFVSSVHGARERFGCLLRSTTGHRSRACRDRRQGAGAERRNGAGRAATRRATTVDRSSNSRSRCTWLKLFVIRCLRGNKFVRNLVAFQGLVVDIRRGLISCFGLVVRGSS